MITGTEILSRSTIHDICAKRDLSIIRMREAAEALAEAFAISATASALGRSAHMSGDTYPDRSGDSAMGRLMGGGFDPESSLEAFRKDLDRRVWEYLLKSCGIKTMMDREAIEELETNLRTDVAEATEDNVRATLERLFGSADMIFNRGLANAFSKLDRRFRSHDGFKIGSRMILTQVFDGFGSWNYHSKMRETLADVERVFAVLDGKKPDAAGLVHAIDVSRNGSGWGAKQSECVSPYFKICCYKNGNAHLWFTRDDLVRKANLILADYYGEAIGDVMPDGKEEDLFNKSNLPVADLQFFSSSEAVIKILLRDLDLGPDSRVLEPSAGTGEIVFEAGKRGAQITAIEIDQDRAAVLKDRARRIATNCTVQLGVGNFLKMKPTADYDYVLMNPPFAGTHYMDHITHAFKFLKEGGQLRSVVPASAEVNESRKHVAFRKFVAENTEKYSRGPFVDLPPQSFAHAGTNINTSVLVLRKPWSKS